ncbi:hypothetical protein TELCIR_20437 [Teladorsagia circumcincta]|uniref:Uncharacterized protein n=1 Tax=Teladorsagia circumcincta TaxID=45464 RepID=A0A2G9TJH5_TELCI|nr:hypothetical protein TELCIR_20437 [Teladorsagia circumcincta]
MGEGTEKRDRLLLMYPNSPHLGCAYGLTQNKGFWLKVVCVMDMKRNPWDPFMPKPYGSPCTKDHDCYRFGWGFVCYAKMGLCFDRTKSIYWIA